MQAQIYTTVQRVGLIVGPIIFFIMLLITPPEGMSEAAMKVAAIRV